MEILFMVFMVFVSVMCLFAVLVVLRDIVREMVESRRQSREARQVAAQAPVAKVEAPVVEAKPEPQVVIEEVKVEEPVKVETPAAQEVACADAQNGNVVFSAAERLTLEQKYTQLSKKDKARYDEIVNYAKKVEGNHCFKNERYEEYKVGKNRLVRMLIKRGIIVCEFILQNSEFRNFVQENKISVKQSATTIKIVDESSVAAAKSSIDIAVVAINEEKEYKKQLAREKRRAKNQAK